MQPSALSDLRSTFGDRLQENVPLSSYTAARIGGPADVLIFVHSADELAQAAEKFWKMDVPFHPAWRRLERAGERQRCALAW